jgi:hypothetical protein
MYAAGNTIDGAGGSDASTITVDAGPVVPSNIDPSLLDSSAHPKKNRFLAFLSGFER